MLDSFSFSSLMWKNSRTVKSDIPCLFVLLETVERVMTVVA